MNRDKRFFESFTGGKVIMNLLKICEEYEKSFLMLCQTVRKGKYPLKGLHRTSSIYIRKLWGLSEKTFLELMKNPKIKEISLKFHISKKKFLLACESIIFEAIYHSFINVLSFLHREHDNKVQKVFYFRFFCFFFLKILIFIIFNIFDFFYFYF